MVALAESQQFDDESSIHTIWVPFASVVPRVHFRHKLPLTSGLR